MVTKREKRWNLFARELEKVLAAHGQSLNQLEPQLGISEEKARRLQQSLFTPKSLPVLSPDELESLEQELFLSNEEWTRLRAALLATSIERLLMERIGEDKAWQVADLTLLLVDEALQEQLQQNRASGTKRILDGEALEDTEMDLAWEGVWNALDSATLALQLSYYVSSYRERVKKLKEAQADFQEALDELNRLDKSTKALPLWHAYVAEVRRGLDSALERLEDLREA